jgi:hypothetical protein
MFFKRELSFSMILDLNSGARCNALPPGLSPRGLTLEQAAAFVGLSKSGYNKRKRMGDYPGPTLPGKRYDLRLLEVAMDRLSDIRNEGEASTPLDNWRETRRATSTSGH